MPTEQQIAEKNALRERMEEYLRQKGIGARKLFHCLNPDHDDQHPSMSFDQKRHTVHCFACGVTYDLFELIGIEYGITEFSEQLARAKSIFLIPTDPPAKKKTPGKASTLDVPAYVTRMRKNLSKTDYHTARGISAKVAEQFSLGYDPAFARTGGAAWKAMIIPTGSDSFTARNTDPGADKRNRIRKHGASPIYNADALQNAKSPIFVVEGEFDALSLYEAGGEAVALGSVANAARFIRMVSQRPPVQPLCICLDNDAEGQRAAVEIMEALTPQGIQCRQVNLCGERNDPNEALLGDRHAFEEAVREAQRDALDMRATERDEYLRQSAGAHVAAFLDGIKAGVDTPAIQTGFLQLDRALDGGLYEGLYIIGAVSSLGKTSFVLQMADQMARRGNDVLIFSLEMARYELMAKSISRETYVISQGDGRAATAKTARGITTGARYARYTPEDLDVIRRAITLYRSYADRLFISEGIGDIGAAQVREAVTRHVELMGRTPVIIVDYLQILAPYSDRATDKQNTDKAVLELKRISRDFKAPVIGISSFNRASYRGEVSMEAFKESGAIEYSSDVLIGLQLMGAGADGFDVTAAKAKNPRAVELVVLKNRNGATGKRVSFEYYAMSNYFREKP